MTLDTLINQLELATKKAMNGDCHASVAEESGDVWLGFGAEWMVGPNGAEMLIDEAQAIAIRHNTAGEVVKALIDYKRLVELQDTSGHWGRIAARMVAERDEWEARFKKAEAEREMAEIHINLIDEWCERTCTEMDLEAPTPPEATP